MNKRKKKKELCWRHRICPHWVNVMTKPNTSMSVEPSKTEDLIPALKVFWGFYFGLVLVWLCSLKSCQLLKGIPCSPAVHVPFWVHPKGQFAHPESAWECKPKLSSGEEEEEGTAKSCSWPKLNTDVAAPLLRLDIFSPFHLLPSTML